MNAIYSQNAVDFFAIFLSVSKPPVEKNLVIHMRSDESIKSIYSEKAKEYRVISKSWTLCRYKVVSNKIWRFRQILVAFSEYINFDHQF